MLLGLDFFRNSTADANDSLASVLAFSLVSPLRGLQAGLPEASQLPGSRVAIRPLPRGSPRWGCLKAVDPAASQPALFPWYTAGLRAEAPCPALPSASFERSLACPYRFNTLYLLEDKWSIHSVAVNRLMIISNRALQPAAH